MAKSKRELEEELREIQAGVRRTEKRLADSQSQIAYLRGQGEASIRAIRNDPEVMAAAEELAAKRGVSVAEILDSVIERHLGDWTAQFDQPGESADPGAADPYVKAFRERLS